jgi:DNA-binding winged helix-turn-helix (wHTH) protein
VENLDSFRTAIRFGVFELDSEAGELRRDGAKVRLQDQPLQILQILLEQPGKVVPREELRKRIWPSDTFVDFDHGINNAIKRLREALGDTAETPLYIETLPRRDIASKRPSMVMARNREAEACRSTLSQFFLSRLRVPIPTQTIWQ